VRLQQHTWKKDDGTPNNGWNFCFGGISTCNKLLAILGNQHFVKRSSLYCRIKSIAGYILLLVA
jgi:hypothetical protein